MSDRPPELIFAGKVAAPGLASGHIRLHARPVAAARPAGSPEEEEARLAAALGGAAARLAELGAEAKEEARAILEFQIALIEDGELTDPVRQAILDGSSAAAAWCRVLDGQVAEYDASEDDYFRARAADLADLRDRVLALLAGADSPAERAPGKDALYVAEDLAPSRFLEIDWKSYRGAALLGGSASSHVAILARALGVPLVIGLGAARLVDGAEAILDAEQGQLIQDPRSATRAAFRARLGERRKEAQAEAAYLAKPAVTRAGKRIAVAINVDEPKIVDSIDPAHCDGIGLTRTEFLFAGGLGKAVSEEAQFKIYAHLVDWAQGRPVTIRTLDAGGDKPIPGLTPEGETNPFLGLRGIRLSLARPDVFRPQLRALARAATRGPLKVMLPMVTVPREVEETRRLLEAAVAELTREGMPAAMPRLGMMVEVPAAALNVAAFAVDFYSIGSNDLVQYVTATSRDCAAVAGLHDPLDPAVLELIGRVAAHGAAAGREVGLCGDMASDPRYLPALLDLGLVSLSVAPARLAKVKAQIAHHG
jgi:phosphoenolpyruvate-protein phosphotransferase (PTS system enzyme I)